MDEPHTAMTPPDAVMYDTPLAACAAARHSSGPAIFHDRPPSTLIVGYALPSNDPQSASPYTVRPSDARCDIAAGSTALPSAFCPLYPASRIAVTVVGQVMIGVGGDDVRRGGWRSAAGLAVELLDVHADSAKHPATITATAARTGVMILRRASPHKGCPASF